MRMWRRPLLSRPESGLAGNLLPTHETTTRAPGAGLHDVFLVSYPFTNRDWLRIVLADLIADTNSQISSIRHSLDIERLVPNADSHEAVSIPLRATGNLRLLKTSRRWEPCIQRAVLILRHPLSTLVSRYHWLCEQERSFQRISIDAFCKAESEQWIGFMQTYCQAVRSSRLDACVIGWERMTERPADELWRVAQYLQLDATRELCERITQRHPCFDRFLAHTRHASANASAIRQPQAELKARTYRWIESNATPWYRRLFEIAHSNRRAA